jgi:hypothetical protein
MSTKNKETFKISHQRICQDIWYDSNYRLYSKEYLQQILKYLEQQELYEECANLQKIIQTRFNHKINYKINFQTT